MWEISADAVSPDQIEIVQRTAEQSDIFSINITEAKSLLQVESMAELVQIFQQ